MAYSNRRLDELCRKQGPNEALNRIFRGPADAANSGRFDSLTTSQQTLVCVWQLAGEMYIGGFDQYFMNPFSDHAHAVPAALKRIGADDVLAVIAKAFAHFPRSVVPADYNERQAQVDRILDARSDVFERLNDEFFEVAGDWSDSVLEQKLLHYIDAHSRDFPEIA
jgi:hypothetical protein